MQARPPSGLDPARAWSVLLPACLTRSARAFSRQHFFVRPPWQENSPPGPDSGLFQSMRAVHPSPASKSNDAPPWPSRSRPFS
ncbi:hypothetical protein DESPIG_00195 [Desulfovibrio piger ATCC 29098]|uniref:Uncharacterized protein n=1 Tax=Desulfovibrio piger ATCC 29098 TaxID=411464 RepID=B6WQ71_9BACT|nr:hypothetical protein DESPIG_00195 [Desulfovibrio piger ATCC 29098]